MKIITVTLLFFIFHQTSALQNISDSDYALIPPIRHLDRFRQCLATTRAVFCTAHADLSADGPSERYNIMKNYTESSPRHFNYSNIVYGFCVTERCKEFYKGDSDAQLEQAMGECLDDYFQKKYGLRASISKQHCFKQGEQRHTFDSVDALAKFVITTLVLLAVAGTVYDRTARDKDPKHYLMCFSMVANWKSLKAPVPKDPVNSNLVGINCMRALTAMIVIAAHASIPLVVFVDDSYAVEEYFEAEVSQLFLHLHYTMQTFIFFGGLFLALTAQINFEKFRPTWRGLSKAVFLRWLRFAPVRVVTLLILVSWVRFAPNGPAWYIVGGDEIRDCRKHWFSMIFYYHNYVDEMLCGLEHWTAAVLMQLSVVGLSIMFLSPTTRIRDALITFMFTIGIIIPAYETYTRDLSGSFLTNAQINMDPALMVRDPMYMYVYRRTHTNMPCFFMGMAFGIYIHKLLKKPLDTTKYKKYSVLYWMLVPCMFALMYSNKFLYLWDGPQPPMALRLLYATMVKPIWGAILILIILGLFYEVESVPIYKRILEWPSWVPLGKMSYSMYNIHVPVLKTLCGAQRNLTFYWNGSLLLAIFGTITVTVLVTPLLWLVVEAPSANVISKLLREKQPVAQLVEKEAHTQSLEKKIPVAQFVEKEPNTHGLEKKEI